MMMVGSEDGWACLAGILNHRWRLAGNLFTPTVANNTSIACRSLVPFVLPSSQEQTSDRKHTGPIRREAGIWTRT